MRPDALVYEALSYLQVMTRADYTELLLYKAVSCWCTGLKLLVYEAVSY